MVGKLFLSSHFANAIGKERYLKTNYLCSLQFFEKKTTVKTSVYKVASVFYSFFQTKMSKILYKIDILFFQLQDYTADGNTRKKNYQCINTVLQIVIMRNY